MATRKIPTPRERISFRDFAQFAQRQKTVAWLVDVTGKDESTVKRYLSGRYEPPASVVTIVLADIAQRLEFKDTQREASGTARKAPSGPL